MAATTRESRYSGSAAELAVTMAAHSGPSQPLANILQSSVDDLRNLVACRICIRPMYEPYTTQCGHTFCYSCLRQWLDRNHTKKTCPDCRAHVIHQPAPAYLIREITQTFINTAALLPSGETTEDHKKSQREEAEVVEKDKANQGRDGGLFKGRFKPSHRNLAPIRDGPDGVDRCPMCTWEIEDGMCASCGYTVVDADPYGDGPVHPYVDIYSSDEDDGSYHSDAQSFDSFELEEVLADNPEELDYDSTGSGNNRPSRRHRRFMEHIRRRAGLPLPAPVHRRREFASMSPSSPFESSEDEYLSDEIGSPGSLQDFMVDDMPMDDNAGAQSDDSDDSLMRSRRDSSSQQPRAREPSSDPHPGDTSDSTAVNTTSRRSRGRRIATSSLDSSDGDHSDSDRSVLPLSPYREGRRSGGGFSPLQHISDDGGSQNIPIQVDSDSDARPIRRTRNHPTAASMMSSDEGESDDPPVRRTRKRPTAASFMSSDEEDDDARGVNISRSRRAPSHSGSARARRVSPPPNVAQRRRPSSASSMVPSPIMIASSPAGSSRRDRSPHLISPLPERSAPRFAHSRSPAGPPRQTAEQRRERKRQKRSSQLSRQQGRGSRGQMNPMGQAHQLAYIGV